MNKERFIKDPVVETRENPTHSESRDSFAGIKLVAEYREFVMFYATPRHLRVTKTQQDFAQRFGVSPDTLSDWKKRPEFWRDVRREICMNEEEDRPELLSIVRRQALNGDLKALALWFKISPTLVESGDDQARSQKNVRT